MTNGQTLKRASEIYQEILWSDEGKEAVEYLKGRKLTKKILHKFQVGFAKNHAIKKMAKGEKWTAEALKHGLVYEGKDFFEGFITFPIRNGGEYHNIYGRSLFKANPPHLYLPNHSKEQVFNQDGLKYRSVVLVEGIIDALTLLQHGINTVGMLTAKVPNSLIPAFKNRVCFVLFDSDAAGRDGAEVVVRKLFGTVKNIYNVTVPGHFKEKRDPNSYFQIVPSAEERIKFLLQNSLPIKKAPFTVSKGKVRNQEDDVPIVNVARVLLKNTNYVDKGNEIWVRCPFHAEGTESNRSLWIGGKHNIFTCFGCNVSGGPTYLVHWYKKISFPEASKWIKENVCEPQN